MAKKTFDIKSTLAVPTRSFSVEDIEAATRQIHQQNEKKVAENQVVVKEKKEKAIKSVVDEVPVRRPKAVQKGKESAIPVSKKTGKPAATPSPPAVPTRLPGMPPATTWKPRRRGSRRSASRPPPISAVISTELP